MNAEHKENWNLKTESHAMKEYVLEETGVCVGTES